MIQLKGCLNLHTQSASGGNLCKTDNLILISFLSPFLEEIETLSNFIETNVKGGSSFFTLSTNMSGENKEACQALVHQQRQHPHTETPNY